METQVINSQSYLTFQLGNEIFGSTVNHVLEIIEVPKITEVPRSPQYMRGVINLRGSVLPVIDTRIKFGMEPMVDTVNTCIVVLSLKVDNQEIVLGALVDAIQAVLEIEEHEVKAPPALGSGYRSDLIAGMVKREDNFILMLNMEKVFSTQEITILKEAEPSETEEATEENNKNDKKKKQ